MVASLWTIRKWRSKMKSDLVGLLRNIRGVKSNSPSHLKLKTVQKNSPQIRKSLAGTLWKYDHSGTVVGEKWIIYRVGICFYVTDFRWYFQNKRLLIIAFEIPHGRDPEDMWWRWARGNRRNGRVQNVLKRDFSTQFPSSRFFHIPEICLHNSKMTVHLWIDISDIYVHWGYYICVDFSTLYCVLFLLDRLACLSHLGNLCFLSHIFQ